MVQKCEDRKRFIVGERGSRKWDQGLKMQEEIYQR